MRFVCVDPNAGPVVTFNNVYPNILVSYDDTAENVEVEITDPNGDAHSYDNTTYPKLFDDGAFNAEGFVDLVADSETDPEKYKIRVKTDGNYTEYSILRQVSPTAELYLKKKILDFDAYIVDDREFVRLFEYYNLFREKITDCVYNYDAYIAYSSDYKANRLRDIAFNIGATAGSYSDVSVHADETDSDGTIKKDTEISVNVTANVANTPTKQAGARATETIDKNVLKPHINYDEKKYRDEDYEFAIDKRTIECKVAYSDELYFAAENGVEPVPEAGSSAEKLYRYARNIMRKIVTDDMTDVEKAHAIYDWVMWRVTYDDGSLNVPDSSAAAYSAYYLEGVLTDGVSGCTDENGDYYVPYAVCDGISKAYSLLCNIEGIPCIRIAGEVSNGGGAHAWNKVNVGGEWYVADCTWGDLTLSFTDSGNTETYAYGGTHDYLFLTDAQTLDHEEAEASSLRYYPSTCGTPIDNYSNYGVDGSAVDALIAGTGLAAASNLRAALVKYLNYYTPETTLKIPGNAGDLPVDTSYNGIEFYFETTISNETWKSVNNMIEFFVRNYYGLSECWAAVASGRHLYFYVVSNASFTPQTVSASVAAQSLRLFA